MTITELLTDFRVDYRDESSHHRHTHRGWVNIECYQCSPNSGKFKLGIHANTLSVNCWSCGRFRLDEVLQEILRVPNQEARNLAYQLRGNREYAHKRTETTRPGTLKIPRGVAPMLKQHRSYLEQRGFDPDELERLWGIQGIGLATKLSWRLFIPITLDGETVSWTTRSISDEVESKYINARPDEEKYPLKQQVFGLEYVRHSAVICEGPLDAIRVGPGAVALMGVNYSQEQVRKLSKIPLRVVALDNEPGAQRQARKLISELSAWPGETHNIILTSGKDASRASEEDVKELRRRFLD